MKLERVNGSSRTRQLSKLDEFFQCWKIYDAGPKTVTCPLVCLLPVSGTADVYFKQLMALSVKGYRIISAEQPPYWSVREWCEGFRKLLDSLGLSKVHLFGASIGI